MKLLLTSMACGLLMLSSCNDAPSQKECASSCCSNGKDSMEVVLNITRKIKPEHVSAFRESFEKCKVSTLLEPGCIDYSMYQSYTDSTVFFIAETWKNVGEHAKHGETPHLKIHIQEIKDMADPSGKGRFQRVFVCPRVNE